MRDFGPFDSLEYGERGDLLDAGALWLPLVSEASMHFSVAQETNTVMAAGYTLNDSALQLQPYAAPRSTGIWEQVCLDMQTSLAEQGGRSTKSEGEYGWELLAHVPTPQGVLVPQRFIGVDGARWMLKASISGPAAVNDDLAAPLIAILRRVVVDRGQEPHPPRELLPMIVPRIDAQSSSHE